MVQRVSFFDARLGPQGQRLLAAGHHVAMRLWEEEPPTGGKPMSVRDYETVGYVIAGLAELELEGQQPVALQPGDSWLVPAGVPHRYLVKETFTAVEATAPPDHRVR